MEWLKKEWWKISLLVILVISLLYWAGMKQEEAELRLANQVTQDMLRQDEEKKKYVLERQQYCLDIYQNESKKWNNTQSFQYDQYSDKCYVQYSMSPRLSRAECDKKFSPEYWLVENMLCYDGIFRNSF